MFITIIVITIYVLTYKYSRASLKTENTMKLYKTTITYEIETLTHEKLNSDDIDLIRHNIQINLGLYNRLNNEGRVIVCQKEIEV